MRSGILRQALASGNVRRGDVLAAQRKAKGIATLRDATRSWLLSRGTLRASESAYSYEDLASRASRREHLGVSRPLDGSCFSLQPFSRQETLLRSRILRQALASPFGRRGDAQATSRETADACRLATAALSPLASPLGRRAHCLLYAGEPVHRSGSS